MASKRINITLDEESIEILDAISSAYGLNRSKAIRFCAELLTESNLLHILEMAALEEIERKAEGLGLEPHAPRASDMLRAAREIELERA